MLILRPEQLAVFQPVADAQFADRVVAYLRRKHPRAVVRLVNGPTLVKRLSDETLMKMVQLGIERARSYDLTWESSITTFVTLMFTVAPNFARHQPIVAALQITELPADERMQKLWTRITSANWEDARNNYDVSAWQLKPAER